MSWLVWKPSVLFSVAEAPVKLMSLSKYSLATVASISPAAWPRRQQAQTGRSKFVRTQWNHALTVRNWQCHQNAGFITPENMKHMLRPATNTTPLSFEPFLFDTCNPNQWVVHHNFDTLLLTHFGLPRSQRSSWIKMKRWVIQPALSLLQSTAQGKAQKWMSEVKSTCGPSDLSLKQCFSSDMNDWQNDIDNWHGKVFFDRITKLQLKLYRSSLSVTYIVVCVSWFKCSILSFFQMMAQFDWMLGHWHC